MTGSTIYMVSYFVLLALVVLCNYDWSKAFDKCNKDWFETFLEQNREWAELCTYWAELCTEAESERDALKKRVEELEAEKE